MTPTLPSGTEILPYTSPRIEWLTARRTGIGASDMPALMGMVSRWATPLSVWTEKTSTAPPDDTPPSEKALVGQILEDPIAECWAQQEGVKLFRTGLWRSSEYPWMLATPDRITGEGQLVEIKTSEWSGWRAGVPDRVQIQVQQQMAVTGTDRVYVVVMLGLSLPMTYTVWRDDDVIDEIVSTGEAFWECVRSGVPPDPVGARDSELMGSVYGRVRDDHDVVMDDELEELLGSYRRVRERVGRLEEEREALGARIKGRLGFSEGVEGVVTWREARRQVVDRERLRREFPEVWEVCVSESVGRRLRIY